VTGIRRFLLLLALLVLAGGAQAAGPAIRVQVQGQQPVLVGQQVPIDVTVVAPNFFLSAPPFPALEVPGAVVTMPDERGIHGVDQVGGQTLASIQKTYVFTAQQPGDFTLPPVKVEFSYHDDDGQTKQASLTLPATRITAQLPAGASPAAAGSPVMPTAQLSIQQTLDRDAAGLAAGDALVRTVEIRAPDAPAMLIPPPQFEAPSGVRMYAADPVLHDSSGPGGGFAGGQRIERVTYVFEKSGRYTLPAVELQWLDPRTQKPVTVQAPAVTVQVKTGAGAGDRIAPELPVGASNAPARKPVRWAVVGVWLAGLAVVVLAACLLYRRWPRWQARRAQARAAQSVSDTAMFDQLLAACEAGDARAAHAALLAWSRAHAQASPQAWAAGLKDAALIAQIDALGRQLFRQGNLAAGAAWSGSACASALREGHRQWLRQAGAKGRGHRWGRGLGPLNPFERGGA